MVSANLSQPTPFERYTIFEYFKFKFIQNSTSIQDSKLYKIQIHIGLKCIHYSNSHIYIQIIAKYFTIFKFSVCTHFHIVQNSKLHQLFTKQISRNYKVEETSLTSQSCRRICHLYGRSHGARMCKCPI
jgi:hypothetical protein